MGKGKKKNQGKRGGGGAKAAEPQQEGSQGGLAVVQLAGVEVTVVRNKGDNTGNNNVIDEKDENKVTRQIETKKVKKVDCDEEKSDKEGSFEEKSEDVTAEADYESESGFEDPNSSLLEASGSSAPPTEDLNLGFLRPSKPGRQGRKVEQRSAAKPAAAARPRLGSRDHLTIEDYVRAGVPRYIATMKHPLENTWTFWYQKNDPSVNWEAQMRPIVDVATIEDFWQVRPEGFAPHPN
jgi:hypothetical protein